MRYPLGLVNGINKLINMSLCRCSRVDQAPHACIGFVIVVEGVGEEAIVAHRAHCVSSERVCGESEIVVANATAGRKRAKSTPVSQFHGNTRGCYYYLSNKLMSCDERNAVNSSQSALLRMSCT